MSNEDYLVRHNFNIQEDALNVAKTLNPSHKVTWINDTHANVDLYVSDCDGAIFNLGFLPGSSSPVTTKKEDTLTALTKLQTLLKPNGILVVVVYPGHPEGQDEHLALQAWLTDLKHPFYAYQYRRAHHSEAPYVILIYKN